MDDELKNIITLGDFKLLIGKVEDVSFDCKKEPYKLDTEAGKRELAKDVSAFANTTGGFILIGIKTKRNDLHFGDEITKIRPFKQGFVDPTPYKDVIASWVYPALENVTVEWVKSKEERKKGILVITIPEQKTILKPFLISKTLDGNKHVETVFGFVQRKGDTNPPMPMVDLQKTLRSGFHYENQLSGDLKAMESRLKQFTDQRLKQFEGQNKEESEKKDNDEKIKQRIEKMTEHGDIKSKRSIIISACPNPPGELKSIFSSSDGSIKKHLENPPTLRRGGWDIRTLDQARIKRGEMIQVKNGERKTLGLYRDGTLIFAGLADHDFLAWGGDKKYKINSLGIIEVIYSFVNFYRLVLDDFEKRPEEIILGVSFRNMHLNGEKSYLVPHHVNSHHYRFDMDKKNAPDNHGCVEKFFATDNFDAGAVAYNLVKEIYLWFGLEEDKIPYVKNQAGVKNIDAEAIKKL